MFSTYTYKHKKKKIEIATKFFLITNTFEEINSRRVEETFNSHFNKIIFAVLKKLPAFMV